MAEPILTPLPNPEIPKAPPIIIGETPMYLKEPLTLGDQTITSFVIQSADKRATAGVGSSVLLVREPSRKKGEEGKLIDKPLLHIDEFDEFAWEKISGVQFTDEQGVQHSISKDNISLSQDIPAHESSKGNENNTIRSNEVTNNDASTTERHEGPPQDMLEALDAKTAPVENPVARNVLETLKDDPNTITIVGLKAYETRARDLAARSMQHLVTPAQREMSESQNKVWEKSKDALKGLNTLGRTMWKQSIGGIYFQERARQYYLDMLKAAETPFAEDAIKMAESRAKATYDKLLADKNFLAKAGTKAVEWVKDNLGMRTMIQKFALQEIGDMKVAGEIKGIESFDREARAVRLRFSQDMDKADVFVRRNLGEKLDILDPSDETHKPLVDGIKGLMRDYATGDIADKKTFDEKAKEFFKTTLKDARPDVFAEAELYSSSLFDAAETLRAKREHVGGMEMINADLDAMKVRLGLAQMGEVTSMTPTQTENAIEATIMKVVAIEEWIESKGIPLRPAIFNEATIGTAVALASTGFNFVKTAPFRALGLGAFAGGAFAGLREYGALQRDYLTHLREREAGDTFGESMKRRNFFEKYLVSQRSANDMMGTIQASLYDEGGAMKVNLTDDELRNAFATITDITARKAVSESVKTNKFSIDKDKRIGLIRYSDRESIESQRTALDVVSQKGLTDLESYLANHTDQATDVLGGNSFEDFMVKLTTNQTTVLKEGTNALENLTEDPIRNVLGLVATYAPEITILKRRFPLGVRAIPPEKTILGMDAILDQFSRDARVEAVKYGIKAGAIGAGVGAVIHTLGEAIHVGATAASEKLHEAQANAIHGTAHAEMVPDATHATGTATIPLSTPTADHTIDINGKTYQLPQEIHIETVKKGFGGDTEYTATIDASKAANLTGTPDITIADHATPTVLLEKLKAAGLSVQDSGHEAGKLIPLHEVKIDGITGPNGEVLNLKLPDGYHLTFDASKQNWQVIDEGDHNAVITALKFNNLGQITGTQQEMTLAHSALMQKGLVIDANREGTFVLEGTPVTHVATPEIPSSVDLPVPHDSVSIDGESMGNGGIWDHFLSKATGENPVSTANAEKNLFRLYEHYLVPQKDGIPQNITLGPDNSNPYNHILKVRDATFGSEKVKEFDIGRIPNDAKIALPNELFGNDAIHKLADINDLAIKDYQAFIAQGHNSHEALQLLQDKDPVEATVLKLSYFDDSKLPTQAELTPLLEKLGYTHEVTNTIGTVATEQVPTVGQTIHEVVIDSSYRDTTAPQIFASGPLTIHYTTPTIDVANGVVYGDPAVEVAASAMADKAANTLPWVPFFIPYRSSLEREYIPPVEADTAPKTRETFLSPFGGEAMYLTKDELAARTSPRLTENADAVLNPQEERAWYLSTLSEEEKHTIETLNTQQETPMAPEVTAVVAIPTVAQNSTSIYNTLSQFTVNQTNADGTPKDLKQTEFVILHDQLPTTTEQQTEQVDPMKAEIDRFRADHPEVSVVYLTKEYGNAPIGQRKRDLSNVIIDRIEKRPEGSPADVAIINAYAESGTISPTYIDSAVTALENPSTELVHGTFMVPKEAYGEFPMLFASMRLQEIFDAMVRHGENDGSANIIAGNTVLRSSTLAAVGGYNSRAAIAEDKELAHIIKTARNNRSDAVVENKDLAQTFDPKLSLYTQLQQRGLVEESVPLEQHEMYKDASWKDLATKVSETITKDQLEQSINAMYQNSYPTLKAENPAAFDAYFSRSLDALGLSHEISDGTVKITDESKLATNMATDLDIEHFAKEKSAEIKASLTPVEEPLNPRESLESIAGTTDEQITETQKEFEAKEEVVGETESPISSPEIQTTPELPEGITDRVNAVMASSTEPQANVDVTTQEFMDYMKTSLDMPVGRLSDGSLTIDDGKIHMTNLTIQTPHGSAKVTADMIEDPSKGLIVDDQSIHTEVPMLDKDMESAIRQELTTLSDRIKTDFNAKISDPNWESSSVHVNGDKITLTFVKKTTTP